MKNNRRYINIFALLAMVVFLAGCNEEAPIEAQEKSEVPVKVETVTFGSLSDSNLLAGTIVAGDQADVGAKATAEIKSILVKKGDVVQRGDTLAVLDDFAEQNALKQQQNVLKQQENAKKQQENALKQQQNGLEQQQVALKQAQGSLKSAENGKRTAENNYEQSKMSLQQAEASLKEARKSKNDNLENIDFQIKNAEIALSQTEQNFERIKALYEEGLASKANYDDAQTAVANAKNALAQVKTNKAQADSEIGLESLEASVEQARIGVNIAKSSISDAEIAVEQAEYSVEQAEKSVEQGKMAVELAQMSVDQAQLAVDQAKLGVDSAKENLDNKTIIAPIAGQITDINAEVGELASPQAPFASIVAVDQVKVSVNVLPEVLQNFQLGDTVDVQVDGVEDVMNGTISYISPLSSGSGLFTVEADLVKAPNSQIRPGMIASFVLDEVLAVDSILVPTESIVQKEGLNVIFVIENNQAVQKEVQINHYGTEKTAVSGDIAENALVVTSGQNLLEDGDPVAVMEEE